LYVLLGGCVSTLVPTLRQPDRLYPMDEEIASLRTSQLAPSDYAAITTAAARNNFISLRMYAIDLEYTLYESRLTHEVQETGLAGTLITLGLTGAASVIPAGDATKALSAAATGITGATAAYDKDILLSQSIQNLQAQMRTDRNNQGAILLANMKCPIDKYPVGQALSDLELYYRAGTMTNALIGLSKTVHNAETTAKATKDSVNPSQSVSAPARAQLATTVRTQAAVVANASSPSCPN
jgi:hypothetical protein